MNLRSATTALLDHLRATPGSTFLVEQTYMQSPLVTEALRDAGMRVIENHADPTTTADHHEDLSKPSAWVFLPQVDYVLGELTLLALPYAHQNARLGLLALADVHYLSAHTSRDWATKHAPDLLLGLPILDEANYESLAWFGWLHDNRPARIAILPPR